jgi:hypothetical protein
VHGEIKKFVVNLWVMRHFFILRGAPRACVDFCDPAAVSRFNKAIVGDQNDYAIMGMLKKAASGVLAFLPCSRTESTFRASKRLRPC